MLHLPSTALYSRIYVWIPIGIYLFERTLRTLRYAYNNIRPGRATLIQLTGGVTKVIVSTRQLKNWSPGSFVLLSLPSFGLGQSHPVTITSIPSSHEGKLVFILKAHRGFTSRIHANESIVSLHGGSASSESPQDSKTTHLALIDGPYGGTQLDFASYTSVLLIAGSTGVTFTLPVLLDLALRAEKQKPLVKHVTFIWAVKTSACTSWIDSELKQFVEVGEGKPSSAEACHCDKGNEECSCISPFPKLPPNTKPNVLAEQIKIQERNNDAVEETPRQELPSYTSRCSVTTIQSGRPDLKEIIKEEQGKADGEIGVAVCGPVELTAEARRVVAGLEGKGGSIYLHAESFGW
jgi:ferric-chelate reductase